MRTCYVKGCYNAAHALGLCPKHYSRQVRTGTTDPRPPRQPKPKAVCSVEGCEKLVKSGGKCVMHYSREKRAEAKAKFMDRICAVEGCDKPAPWRPVCAMHTKRMKIYGSYDLPPRVERRKFWKKKRRKVKTKPVRPVVVTPPAPPPHPGYGDVPLEVWMARQRAALSGGGPARVLKVDWDG